jgi:hypothetical protein
VFFVVVGFGRRLPLGPAAREIVICWRSSGIRFPHLLHVAIFEPAMSKKTVNPPLPQYGHVKFMFPLPSRNDGGGEFYASFSLG